MARRIQQQEVTFADLQFPSRGVFQANSYGRQPPMTAADAMNVVAFDPRTDRMTGGRRPGLSRYFLGPLSLDGDFSVQEITQLSANIGASLTDDQGSIDSNFTYALAVGSGSAVGKGVDLTALATLSETAISNYKFMCSCWDDEGNVYIGMQNISDNPGVMQVFSYSINAAQTGYTFRWKIGATQFNTGSATSTRCINGMTVIRSVNFDTGANETHLYVAMSNSAHTVGYIFKIQTTDGTLISTPGETAGAWVTSNNSSVSFLLFSTNSHNILAACGTILGVDVVGGMYLIQTERRNAADSTRKLLFAVTYPTGPSSTTEAKVVSDGSTFFYAICSTSGTQIRRIGTNGSVDGVAPGGTNSPTWSASAAINGDTPLGLVYDKGNYEGGIPRLIAIFNAVGGTGHFILRQLSIVDGSLVTGNDLTLSPVEVHNEIDSNNAGIFTLWKNSDSTNNVRRLNTSLTLTTTATLPAASVIQNGSSVNKAGAGTVGEFEGGVRQVTFLAISGGKLQAFTPAGPVEINGGQSLSIMADNVYGAACQGKMFFADGQGYFYFDPAVNGGSLLPWTASSAGLMPVDSSQRACRLIEPWGGGLVLAGLIGNPQTWFMPRLGDPFDFDYAKRDPLAAVSNTSSEVYGDVGQPINCMIPFSDDLLIFGLDHGIVMLSGRPSDGGAFDDISQTIGMAYGRPWCKDELGRVYFFANHGGVYRLVVGGAPELISVQIKRQLEGVDLRLHTVRMVWDVIAKQLYVFITPKNPSKSTVHWIWEARTNAWFPFEYQDSNFNPMAAFALDGDDPNDRTVVFGSRDGKIRTLDYSSNTDDGRPIPAFFIVGPITDKELNCLLLKAANTVMSENSGRVTFEIFSGHSPEAALNSTVPTFSGSWGLGRNVRNYINRSGHAHYIKVSSSDYFGLENIRIELETTGGVRRRGL